MRKGSYPMYVSEKDMERLRSIVSRYFPVYSSLLDRDSVVFFCEIDEDTLEERFDSMRIDLRKLGYIPIIKESKGEYMIYLTPFDRKKGRSVNVNIIMLILTVLSTTFAGIFHWASYTGNTDDLYSLSNIANGILYFSFPLLLILGTHEMGHYFMAKRRNVRASLPFFMPFMPPLGTMGAFISLREPIPDRKSLLDIGIAGPIAGFVVAVPVTIIGMLLGNMHPPADTAMQAGTTYMLIEVPLIYRFLGLFIPGGEFMHPMAFAGWVGFIVTAINLFPAGQLDGGHIARAALGERATYASYASLITLFLIGIFTGYWGWIIFGSLIFFLGARHAPPLNDISRLDSRRKGMAVMAAVMLAISFVAVPMDTYTPRADIYIGPMGQNESLNMSALPGSEMYFNFTLENTGEAFENISVIVSCPKGWNATVFYYGSTEALGRAFTEPMNAGDQMNYSLVVRIPGNATPFLYELGITATLQPVLDLTRSIGLNVLVPGNESFSMMVLPQSADSYAGSRADYAADVVNLCNGSLNLSFSVVAPDGWGIVINGQNASSIHLSIAAYGRESVPFSVLVPENTEQGRYVVVAVLSDGESTQSAYLELNVLPEYVTASS